jgi:OmpA-OmpF porin, OOP family
MIKNTLKLTSIALLGCAISNAVHAQTQSASYSTSYNPSWYIAPSVNLINPDNNFSLDNRGEGLGLRLGKPISPSWDIQFGPTYSRAKFGTTKYEQTSLGVDALYMFSRGKFRPFVLAGLGAEYDQVKALGASTSRTSPYINAGLGFQVAFSEQWGMQADLRRSHAYLKGNSFAFDRANTTTVTLALTYAFDAPRTPMLTVKPETTPYVPPPVIQPPAPIAQAPVPVPAPPPPPPPSPARFEKITLSSTDLFAFDSSVLPAQHSKLDAIADALNKDATVKNVSITGYTDRLGSAVYNIRLSQRRADAVKMYLSQKGVAESRLIALGKGEENPVVQCNDKKKATLIECLAPNRRVEVDQITIEQRVQ